MKVKLFLLTLLMVTVTFSTFSKIRPGGGGGKGQGTMSLTSEITIAMDDNNTIIAYFNEDIGVVEITITNAMNTVVYQKTVDSATTDEVNINIANLPVGTYNLAFKGSDGNVISSAYLDIE